MNDDEKREYAARVETTHDRLSELTNRLRVWEESDLKEYHEGCDLCCAFQNYISSVEMARRSPGMKYVSVIHRYLSAIREKSELGQMKSIPADHPQKQFFAHVPTAKTDADGNEVTPASDKTPEDHITELDGRRPDHLDQYVRLLSPELQKALYDPETGLKNLYLIRAYNRNMAVTADKQGQSAEFIAPYTERTVEAEKAIRLLWARVDAEYEALEQSGDNEPEPDGKTAADAKKPLTKAEIDAMPDGEEKGMARAKRIESNRKYISRTDVKMTDKRIAELELRKRELEEWGEKEPTAN